MKQEFERECRLDLGKVEEQGDDTSGVGMQWKKLDFGQWKKKVGMQKMY